MKDGSSQVFKGKILGFFVKGCPDKIIDVIFFALEDQCFH